MNATERLAEADRILNLPTAREYVAAMLLELADARADRAEADQRVTRTVTEWAIWFDADDPNGAGSAIYRWNTEDDARHVHATARPGEFGSPGGPSGVCFRTVTTCTSPWSPVSLWTAGKP